MFKGAAINSPSRAHAQKPQPFFAYVLVPTLSMPPRWSILSLLRWGRKNLRTSSKQRAAIRRPPRLGQLLGQPHGKLIFQLLGRKVSFPPCLRTAVPLSRSSKSFSPLLPFSIFVHDTVLLRLPSQPRSLQPHACSRAKWDRLGSGDSSQARGQFGRRQRLRA